MARHLKAFAASCLILLFPALAAAGPSAEESGWKLINTDVRGNSTYMDAGSLERLDGSRVRVTMKYVSAKTDTQMFFVDELDCERGLIKRLSMSLKSPPCTGGTDYDSTFEGKWDKVSTGLEEKLRDAVCAEGKARPGMEDP
jgi:hypothetical protein